MSAPGIIAGLDETYMRRATAASRSGVITRFFASRLQSLGPREFMGIAATDALCPQDGVALDMKGADLSFLDKLAWNHQVPIGTVTKASTTAHELLFTGKFAPEGTDDETDALCRKVKAGVPMGVSIKFLITKSEPLNPKQPKGPVRATKWQALEISLVLVGADPAARITARSKFMQNRNTDSITSALAHTEQAIETHQVASRHQDEMQDSFDRLREHHRTLKSSMRALRRALEAGDAQQAADCHARCSRSIDGITRESRLLRDRHADADEAHANLCRAMADAESGLDTQAVQTSSGVQDDHGSSGARSHGNDDYERRQRQLEVLELAAAANR